LEVNLHVFLRVSRHWGLGWGASGRRRATAAFPLRIKHNVSVYQKSVCAIDLVSRRGAVRKQKSPGKEECWRST